MNANPYQVNDAPTTPRWSYCERIICLSDPGMAADWWLAYLEPETDPPFAPDGRLQEAPLDRTRQAVQEAVAQGYRPHLFVPRASDWPAVYDVLGPYRDFARLWVCGRDDLVMAELLKRPSEEICEAVRTGGDLVVPDPEYGKALDLVLDTRLQDFHPDPSLTLSESDRSQTPWQTAAVRVSRLNPFRVLEVELDRMAGKVTLRQFYVTADPAGPREPCEREVCLADGVRLKFDRGNCDLDREDLQVAAICRWLGARPLILLSEPHMGPLVAWCRGLSESRARARLLSELEKRQQKGDFLLWMRAWAAGYYGDKPSLLPTGAKLVKWAARALEEIILELNLLIPLRAAAIPLPISGVVGMRGAGGMRRTGGDQELEERLSDVAQAFLVDDESDGP